MGANLFKPTTASGQPLILNPTEQGAGAIAQGMLEASNVNVVEELVTMIETQRAYEVNSKAISAIDSMLRFLQQQSLVKGDYMRVSLMLIMNYCFFGCAASIPVDNLKSAPFIPVVPEVQEVTLVPTGSIFADEKGSRHFGYKRKYQVGDVLTVILTESTRAQRKSGLEAVKEGTNSPMRSLQSLIATPINAPLVESVMAQKSITGYFESYRF